MNNISFKQRVCQSIIDQSKIYKKIFIDRQYLICSKCFTNRKYYILVANKDNYLHLVGVHTTLTPSEFFEKCFNDTLTENVKGSVRRKISALENINNFFAQELYIEEGFRKNKVSCVIATSDNKITIGFSEGIYSRPKTLLKGNMLNMSTNQIDLILSKEKKDKTFNKIEYGNEQILSYYHKDIYHLISKNLI